MTYDPVFKIFVSSRAEDVLRGLGFGGFVMLDKSKIV